MLTCFLMVPTEFDLRTLEVDVVGGVVTPCSKNPFEPGVLGHHGLLVIGEVPRRDDQTHMASYRGPNYPAEQPWPTTCLYCDAPLEEGAQHYERSIIEQRLYRRADRDGGVRFTLNETPPGAMWYAPWYHDPAVQGAEVRLGTLSKFYRRDWATKRPPLVVRAPNGMTWQVDNKSRDGEGWEVTGEAPRITCTPSIVLGEPGAANYYHGYLRDGVFGVHLG